MDTTIACATRVTLYAIKDQENGRITDLFECEDSALRTLGNMSEASRNYYFVSPTPAWQIDDSYYQPVQVLKPTTEDLAARERAADKANLIEDLQDAGFDVDDVTRLLGD